MYFLNFFAGKIEMSDKCFMLGFGLIKKIHSIMQSGFSLFIEIVISTESMTKSRNPIF